MIRHTKLALVVAAVCGALFLMAPLQGAKAYDDYMDACRKWVGQGAGQQYKCFDCMKTITDASGSHWVNTCARDRYSEGWSWY